jgi:putative membrane protein
MSISKPSSWSERLYIIFTGMCMGAADIVPGVSGGTMAFIMGVYQDLLEGIKSFDVALIRKALRFDLKAVFAQIPWQFLLLLAAGLGSSVLSLAGALHTAYEHHRIFLYAFFFGLVLASAVLLARDVPWTLRSAGGLILGALIGYLAVTVAPVDQLPSTFLVHTLCGAVAITAMILPGISGSFILLILGKYDTAISAVKELDVLTLAPFALGAVLGLLAFTRFLSWVLHRWHHLAVATLIGFMVGSLRKLFPWKEEVNVMVRDGETIVLEDKLILPELDRDFGIALLLIVAGMLLIGLIEWIRKRKVPCAP